MGFDRLNRQNNPAQPAEQPRSTGRTTPPNRQNNSILELPAGGHRPTGTSSIVRSKWLIACGISVTPDRTRGDRTLSRKRY
ncbi:hypothetical protein BPODLACK_03896 [Gordonia sp. YY1]|nr:hypothetical protein BPODLACK_03896 [Gordonia sp. YY1]